MSSVDSIRPENLGSSLEVDKSIRGEISAPEEPLTVRRGRINGLRPDCRSGKQHQGDFDHAGQGEHVEGSAGS